MNKPISTLACAAPVPAGAAMPVRAPHINPAAEPLLTYSQGHDAMLDRPRIGPVPFGVGYVFSRT